MKKGMNQIQKGLLVAIGVLSIILAAVLVSKGIGFYQDKKQEKEWAARHQEIQEEIVSVQVKIEELAGDADALQAFLDEQVNSVLVLDEWQAEGQEPAGQEGSQESAGQMPDGSGQGSSAMQGETGDEAQEVTSGAIVIQTEEMPQDSQPAETGNTEPAGEATALPEVSDQALQEAAEGAIIIDAPPAPIPPAEETIPADVPGDSVSGNGTAGTEGSGESSGETEEDTVSGNGTAGTEGSGESSGEAEEDTVSGNGTAGTEGSGESSGEEEEDTVSGNGTAGTEGSGESSGEAGEDTVSGNGTAGTEGSGESSGETEEDTVSGNGTAGTEGSGESSGEAGEDTVSGNGTAGTGADTVSGNTADYMEEAETISGNAVVNGQVIPFERDEAEPTLEQRRKIRSSYLETLQINGEDRAVLDSSSYDFSDVRIACLGDSLTEGSNLDKMENYQQYSYPSVLKNLLNAEEVYNLGMGGSSYGRYWDNAFVDRYHAIPQDADIILVMGGTNDGFAASEKELGSLQEKKKRTFYGDVDELMQGLKRDYPNAKIVFATPLPNVLHDYLRAQRSELLPQSLYAKAIKELADQYQIEVIDLYNSNILDTHDAQVIANYMPDGVHGNPEGYRILAEHIASELIEIAERGGLENGSAGTVSGNAVSGADAMTPAEGMVPDGTPAEGMPEQAAETVSPEERQRAEAERLAREREEAERAAENNRKVAADAMVIAPVPDAVPAQPASPETALPGEMPVPEDNYQYDGEAIVIQ